MLLHGRFRILLLYDIGEAFDLEKIRKLVGTRAGPRAQAFPRRTPEYVRFEDAPIVEPAECITLASGEQVVCSIKYYAYALVVVQLEVPFEADWDALLAQAARWMDAAYVEPQARETVRRHLARVATAITKPRDEWLQEEYLVVHVERIQETSGQLPSATELTARHGHHIAQIIRGELVPLAPTTMEHVLEASISYYPSDLAVIGSAAALVYDRAEDAAATIQILEYAKMQLLEFRYYDQFMTRVLSNVYDALERKKNIVLQRWSVARDANRLKRMRLDVMDLTERIDSAIKFVSDAFYARVYRLAAKRVGVPEYRDLVEKKLETAGQLYELMVDQFNEARSFVLEVAVAILALLDVLFLLRGK